MSKNIVFFDIDGTLINEHTHIIPESTKIALKKLKEKGNLSFINTGRPLSEITPLIRSLDFNGYLCGCGTYIEFNNEVLFYKSLGKKLSREIADDVDKFKLEGILEGRDTVYFDNFENIKHKDVLRIMNQHKSEGFFYGSTWHEENIEIDKFVVFINENSDFNSFYEKYKDRFEFIKRAEDFYEVIPLGYSKASGIKYISNYLDIPLENTYAIGDSTNDLAMLEYAHTSIAMGNSTPSLFDKVSFVTKDIYEDGIYYALKHYNLI